MKDDVSFYPLMLDVRDEIGVALAARELPSVCFLGLEQSAQVEFDVECDGEGDCQGKAWVRLVTAFPSTSFPTPDTGAVKCGAMLAATLEVGIIRCVPVGDDDGNPPDVDEVLQVTRVALSDMQALRTAICAALSKAKRAYSLGTYQAFPISGAAGGGTWQFTVWTQ